MTREEGRQKERNFRTGFKKIMKWLSGFVALSILVYFFMGVYIEGNRQKGLKNSKELLSAINISSVLPWESDNYNIIAVVNCDDENIFLKKNESIGSEMSGCIVHLAENVVVEKSFYKLKPNARLKLKIINE